MHPKQQPDESVRRLLKAQAGVISMEQAAGLGLGYGSIERLSRDEFWTPIAPRLYLRGPMSLQAMAWGGVLRGGEGSCVGGLSAAALHGLKSHPCDQMLIWTPPGRHIRHTEPWRFRRGERDAVGDPPRTRVEDTIIDCARELTDDAIVALLSDAFFDHKTTQDRMLAALSRRERCAKRRLLKELSGDVGSGAHSPLEVRYLRDVERAHGLPKATRQGGPDEACTDNWYKDYGLIVELDGRANHEGSSRARDMARDNLHQLRQVVTLRYGWASVVGSPCLVASEVARALIDRGWSGTPHSCPSCRKAWAA